MHCDELIAYELVHYCYKPDNRQANVRYHVYSKRSQHRYSLSCTWSHLEATKQQREDNKMLLGFPDPALTPLIYGAIKVVDASSVDRTEC